jgi:hypothetical protein
MSIFGEFDREAVDDEVRGLRKQVADLSAENAKLKRPFTEQEVISEWPGAGMAEAGLANAMLIRRCGWEKWPKDTIQRSIDADVSSRSKEPQTVAEQIEIVPYVACVHGSEIRKPICDECYERWLASRSKEPKGATE